MSRRPAAQTGPGQGDRPTPGDIVNTDIDVELLADAIPHAVWVAAPQGTLEYLNRRAIDYTGQDLASPDTPGGGCYSLVHPDDRDAAARQWAKVNGTGAPYAVDCRIRGADGLFRWHSVKATAVRGDAGRIVRWIGTATDVEDRNALEDRERRSRLESQGDRTFQSVIVDSMAEGLYTVDGDGMLTALNSAGARMLGWEEKDLLGRSVHAAVHFRRPDGTPLPESECSLLGTRLLGVRTGARSTPLTDETFIRKDGSTFPVSCSAAPLKMGATGPGAVIVFRDMTEVRRAELEARHDQKLESLGRLSAGLAHEINTPIQFVGDNTRFLASAYQDMLELLLVYRTCMAKTLGEMAWDERTRLAQEAETKADVEYLASEIPVAASQSLEGVERVASLVRAMKSFSYKDSAEQSYADLNEAIRTTLTVARNEVKYVADVTLDLGELPEVMCHRGDLNQVFLNLLINAGDALEGKGERGEIRITSRAEGPTAVISFADNGSGIPEHIKRSIFEPFFTTKEVGRGTGQGLALARAVLDKHGGSIEVRSVVGEGTTFTLRLPVAGKPASSA
jgi:two-component system NtrC family sensor kinase